MLILPDVRFLALNISLITRARISLNEMKTSDCCGCVMAQADLGMVQNISSQASELARWTKCQTNENKSQRARQ
jgi:hypothetical protein